MLGYRDDLRGLNALVLVSVFSEGDLTMGKLEESLPLVTAANPAWVFSQIREREIGTYQL